MNSPKHIDPSVGGRDPSGLTRTEGLIQNTTAVQN
jgi:hypothetical protein